MGCKMRWEMLGSDTNTAIPRHVCTHRNEPGHHETNKSQLTSEALHGGSGAGGEGGGDGDGGGGEGCVAREVVAYVAVVMARMVKDLALAVMVGEATGAGTVALAVMMGEGTVALAVMVGEGTAVGALRLILTGLRRLGGSLARGLAQEEASEE
jgi:hypothetical protein